MKSWIKRIAKVSREKRPAKRRQRPKFAPRLEQLESRIALASVGADFNGDTKTDKVDSSVDNLGLLTIVLGETGLPAQHFQIGDPGSIVYHDAYVDEIIANDVNLDGLKDLIITQREWTRFGHYPNGAVQVLFGTGKGTFVDGPFYPANGTMGNLLSVADRNADGVPDIVLGTGANPQVFFGTNPPPNLASDNFGSVGLSLTNGPTTGGTLLTVTGNYHSGSSYYNATSTKRTVYIGGKVAPIQSENDSFLVVTTPAGTGINLPVMVAVGGRAIIRQGAFSYDSLSIAPSSGPAAGGFEVTVAGRNFSPILGRNLVVFDNTVVEPKSVNPDGKSLVVVVPVGTSATATIHVLVDGQKLANPAVFHYNSPVIGGIMPATGPTSGGTRVTLSGTSFSPSLANNSVAIGGVAATVLEVNAAGTQLVVESPAGAGLGNVVKATVFGQSSADTPIFNYQAPQIASLSVNRGPATGGTIMTIFGANFAPAKNLNTVTIGGNSANVVSVNPVGTELVVATPSGTGVKKEVKVVTSGQVSGAHLFHYDATITSFDIHHGPTSGNTPIKIVGTSFSPTLSENLVSIGGNPAIAESVNAAGTELIVKTPAGAGTGKLLSVTIAGRVTTAADAFSYDAPVISGFVQASHPTAGNAPLTIQGSNFSTSASVKIDGKVALLTGTGATQTQIVVLIPAGAGADKLLEVTVGDQVATASFSYDAPGIDSLVVSRGADGATLIINGGNFSSTKSANLVLIGGKVAAIDGAPTASQLVVKTLEIGADQKVLVVVGGQPSNEATVDQPAPAIASVTPTSASAAGGDQLTIFGTNFAAAKHLLEVTLGGVPAPVQNVSEDGKTLLVKIPPGVGAGKLLKVTVAGKPSNDNRDFSYRAPAIASLTLNHGPTSGGTQLTIFGSSFAAAKDLNQVTIGGVASEVVGAFAGGTALVVETPPGVGVGKRIAVTVGGQASLENILFNYDAPTIASLELDHGPPNGGSLLIIHGSGFDTSGASNVVSIGGASVPVKTVGVGGASLVVAAPAGMGVGKQVKVVVASQVSNEFAFHYDGPVISALSVDHGPLKGGTRITIAGANFSSTLADNHVTVGGIAANRISVDAAGTKLVVETPAGSGKGRPLQVVVASQSSNSVTFDYDPPSIESIQPNHGAPKGNTLVTITGSFPSGGSVVTIGGVPATLVSGKVDGTELVVRAPAGAGVNLPVQVAFGLEKSNTVTYDYDAPTITSLSVNHGVARGGTELTVLGSNFAANLPLNQVTIGDAAAPTIRMTPDGNGLVVLTPPGIGSDHPVVVRVAGQPSNAAIFDYDAPLIASVSPTSLPTAGGSELTILGSNFATDKNLIQATIGGVPVPVVRVSDSLLVVATPPGAGVGKDVQVTVASQLSNVAAIAYNAPKITSLSTDHGSPNGGTLLVFHGSDFDIRGESNSVTIDGASVPVEAVGADGATLVVRTLPGVGLGKLVQVIVANQPSNKVAFNFEPATIVSIVPNHGSTDGSAQITLTGKFSPTGNVVSIGGVTAPFVSINNEGTKLVVIAPRGEGARKEVSISGGSGPSNSVNFDYDAPTITRLSILHGVAAGGDLLTVFGTNFGQTAFATIGGQLAMATAGPSQPNQLVVRTPAGVGAGHKVVVTAAGQTNDLAAAPLFNYDAPTITSLSENRGPTVGNTSITIAGNNFSPVLAENAVKFGEASATLVSVNAAGTSLVVRTPPGVGAGRRVMVIVAEQESLEDIAFDYHAPKITALSIDRGAPNGGTLLMIHGSDFDAAGVDNRVTIDGVIVPVEAFSLGGDRLVVKTPPGAGVGKLVQVTVAARPSNSLAFSYDIATVTSVFPSHGTTDGGTLVTLTGKFSPTGNVVTIGGSPAPFVGLNAEGTKLVVQSPSGEGTQREVRIVSGSGTASAPAFNYDAPTISSLSTYRGAPSGGELLTVSGTNFGTSAIVKIGGKTAPSIGPVIDGKRVVVRTPVGVGTGHKVVVFVSNQSSDVATAPLFNYDAPTIASLSVNHGPPAGGTTITIAGNNFSPVLAENSVRIGETNASLVFVNSGTELVVRTPAGTGTNQRVVVTVGGQSNALDSAPLFHYGALGIFNLTPSHGSVAGGGTTTIAGFGFLPHAGDNSVTIGGEWASVVGVNSSGTELVVLVPPGAKGSKTVKVTVNNATVTSAVKYTYDDPEISGLNPERGSVFGGTLLTISGSGFGPNLWQNQVTIGGQWAEVQSVNAAGTQLIVSTPTGKGKQTLKVKVAGASNAANATATYTYEAPTILRLEPSHGPVFGGTRVTVIGSGFSPNREQNQATIGGQWANVESVNAEGTQLVIVSPPGQGNREVKVKVADVQNSPSTADTFTYDAPTILLLSVDRGPTSGETRVTIFGSGFAPSLWQNQVTIGGQWVQVESVNSEGTQLVVVLPPGTGRKLVKVEIDGVKSNGIPYTYE